MNDKIDEFKIIFGKNILTLRTLSGILGTKFAKELAISRAHLFNLENGLAHGISFETLNLLSTKYKLNLDDLFKKIMTLTIVNSDK